MFIQTETTPNPHSLKFFPNGVDLGNVEGLKRTLLNMEEVKEVFFSEDFIAINKAIETPWEVIKPAILSAISDYFISNQAKLYNPGTSLYSSSVDTEEEFEEVYDEKDKELVGQIKELLETRVRPAVLEDGGNIVFKAYKEGVLWLKLQGACAGCPSSTATLKDGIQNMMQYYIPEVQQVEAIN